jgi:glutathione-regulated potassium-efflux system ancillary protein KefG
MARRVLVLYAHPAPHKSRINRRLFAALEGLEGITRRDLYAVYPDLLIDVAAEQQLLREHQVIVFQHPFYWYSSPALLKEWQDLVLEHGFAYGRQGNALVGKMCLSAVTTGGGQESYTEQGMNRYGMRELLRPFEATARLCGMTYLPPFVVHGTHRLEREDQIQPFAEAYARALCDLRDELLDPVKLCRRTFLNVEPQASGGPA